MMILIIYRFLLKVRVKFQLSSVKSIDEAEHYLTEHDVFDIALVDAYICNEKGSDSIKAKITFVNHLILKS